MEWDDIVYLVLLFSSIGFGYFYRKIQSAEDKKVVGTIVGLTIILIVSGLHFIHTVIFTFVNSLIILNVSKRKCHLVSFVFSFGYLIFFRTTIYFGIPYPPGHTNLIIMMLTLKLVGLAFEINTSHMNNRDESNDKIINDNQFIDVEPKFMDIIHYAFNFVAVLTGPYYSYKTYWDSLYLPYSKHAKCEVATLKNLTYVPLYAALFLWATYTWPLSYALSDEFYTERSVLYRFWYTIPSFFIFRMRICTGIVLSECVCIMAGVGAYPELADSKPGRGPSSEFSVLKQIELCKDTKILEQMEYNFNTIKNVALYKYEVCNTLREGMKHWNICVQYWMAVNVYKRFPTKKFRTLATLFVSSVWHGVYIGYYVTITGAPFYLPVEDLYVKLFLKDNQGKSAVIWKCVIWISKSIATAYLGMAFYLLTIPKVMRFYNSIYHLGAIGGVLLYVIGVLIARSRPKKSKVPDETKKVN